MQVCDASFNQKGSLNGHIASAYEGKKYFKFLHKFWNHKDSDSHQRVIRGTNLLVEMFMNKVKNFCDHSMILCEMAVEPVQWVILRSGKHM